MKFWGALAEVMLLNNILRKQEITLVAAWTQPLCMPKNSRVSSWPRTMSSSPVCTGTNDTGKKILGDQALGKHTVTWRTQSSQEIGVEDIEDAALSFHAYSGETLRTAALRRNVVSPHNGRANLVNCRGLGTCGTCAVEIVSGRANVEPPARNQIEKLRFNFPPHNFHNNTNLRLACQIQIFGDVEVIKRTGFWGQQKDLAVASNPQHYFGNLEYLLDGKSPDVESTKQPEDNSEYES